MAYTEFYFTSVHWPDFNKEEFVRALYEYQQRQRRFGLVLDEPKAHLEVAEVAGLASERRD